MEGVLSRRRLAGLQILFIWFSFVLLGSLTESQSKFSFITQPQDANVILGRPVTLNCSATFGSKKIRYWWNFDDTRIRSLDSRVVVNKDGSLSITSAQKEDAGEYQCHAKTRNKGSNVVKRSRKANLVVQSICSTAKIVTVDTPLQPIYAAGGKTITLRCKCNVMPKVTVQWKKDGAVVSSSSKFTLEKPKVGDSGSYTCTATNIVGTKESPPFKLNIIVTSDPIIQVGPQATAVNVGESVLLDCVATGDPAPTISWYSARNSKPLSDNSKFTIMKNGTLRIDAIQKDEFGNYKCMARNMVSSKAAVAEVGKAYIGSVQLEPKSRYVLEGMPFTHDCKVKGLLPPKITWTKADGKALPRRYDVKGTALRNNKTRMADSGNFTCTASNSAGKQIGTVQIIISQPPVFTAEPKSSVIAMETKKVVLECSAKAVPPPIMLWSKDGKEVMSDRNHIIDSKGYLTMNKVSKEDQGVYLCRAQHLGGWSKAKTSNLTVLASIKLDDYHQAHHKFDKGSKGKVYCSFKGHGPIKIKWKKVGSSKLANKVKANGDTLIINDMDMSDAGMYACTGINSFSNLTAYVNVSVYVYPKFELKPKNTTAIASDSIWLHCNASGFPKPKISWGKETHGGDNLDKERFIQFENGTLHIKDIRPNDEGRYYCIAGNLADFKQITISIKVVQNHAAAKKQGAASMGRTIGIAVGCAAAYIVLVVGLMIYCKGRRARQQKKEQLTMPVNGDIENDEEAQDDLALQPINTRTGYNKMEFPRHDLEALRTLGNGSYGRAFLARASGIRDGERDTMVVVKSLIAKDDIVREDFMRELDALVTMEHTNIVSLLGVCKEIEPHYMIFESLEKGDLKQFLLSCYDNGRSNLTSSQKLTMCSNIASGMSYLSANKFVHKDLAARNCMVTKDFQVKIGFLSLSYDLYNAEYYRFNNILIPLRWMPSEAIFHDDFTEKSDVWSFGVLAWEIYMLGQTPYLDRSDEEVLKCVKDDLRLSKPDNCPDSVATVMKKCWEVNPNDRPTFDMIFSEMAEVAVDSHV